MGKISDDSPADLKPVNRRSALEHFMPGVSDSHLFRSFGSREKMVEGIKTFAWVVPLTILIWVYAEREQAVQPKSPNVSNVPIQIFSRDQNRDVEPGVATVNLKLTGTQEAVRRVSDALTVTIPRTQLRIDIGSSLGKGKNQPVNVVDYLQNMEPFKSSGVTVEESQPTEIFVNIDTIGSEPVTVNPPPDATNLASSTKFEPAKVNISGPDELLRQLKNRGQLNVYPDLSGNAELLKQPGDHPPIVVPLMLPATVDKAVRDKIHIDPAQVTATISVNASDETYEFESMQLLVFCPPEIMNKCTLELPNGNGRTIPNVRVTGPHDQILQLQNKSFPASAWISLSEADIGGDQSRTLQYHLPPDVKPSDADAARTIQFKLTRRDPSGI